MKEASSDADSDVFNKEMLFYEEIVPKINELLDDLGEPEIFPEVFGVCKTKKIVILGDLLAKDYQILPASRGYNIPESKVILKKLAVFHAICAVLQEKEADIFANFAYGWLNINKNLYCIFVCFWCSKKNIINTFIVYTDFCFC